MSTISLTSTELTYDEGNLKRLQQYLFINTMAFNTSYNKVDVLRDDHGIQAVNTLTNSIFKVAGKTK
jgi:hypothetical protein